MVDKLPVACKLSSFEGRTDRTRNTDHRPAFLRRDLYQQMVSADPVTARLPRAISTKMISIPGWKRFEMSETMMFEGIKDAPFPSDLRPSLVINLWDRFLSAKELTDVPPTEQEDFLWCRPESNPHVRTRCCRPFDVAL